MKEAVKSFLEFEKILLSKPQTMFLTLEAGINGRRDIIWSEFLEWQKLGGKIEDIKFRDLKDGVIMWSFGNEYMAQKIEPNGYFTVDQYKKGLSAIYSFMNDRPQYYKFRKLDGMMNPLRLLLYKFL